MEPTSPRAIFDRALEIESPDQRREYVDQACAGQPRLRARVEALLCAHAAAGSFLESPAVAPRAGDLAFGQATAESPRELAGTVIGRYRLLEQIGEGGMGVVFIAQQTQPVQRKVALKVIKAGVDTRHLVARFEAERQALAMMDHENIAKLFDAGTTDSGRPYFVMELVDGVPITDYCDDHRLSPPERLELFVTVCAAVQHAHTRGVLHRDIKPTNVLVATRDGVPVPKVIDFGVAKATGETPLTERTLFTHLAQMIGTPLYMSPEQAEMSGLAVDHRSDVYSLGVLLYELLTGTTPVDADRLRLAAFDEVRRIIREEQPQRPSIRLSTVARLTPGAAAQRGLDAGTRSGPLKQELDWIVMKCLEKDRRLRYASAGGLAEDVERYLHDRPIVARPPTVRYRLRKFARRHRGALAVSTLLVTVVAVTAGTATSWRDRAARDTAASEALRQSAARLRLYEAVRTIPARYNRLSLAGQHDAAAATYEGFLRLAGEVYAPGEVPMVHYRLKFATAVGNTRRFAEAERLITEAVADSRSAGSFGPAIEANACERLVYLYSISGQPEKGAALAPRLAELQRQLSLEPIVRPPLPGLPVQTSPAPAPTSQPRK